MHGFITIHSIVMYFIARNVKGTKLLWFDHLVSICGKTFMVASKFSYTCIPVVASRKYAEKHPRFKEQLQMFCPWNALYYTVVMIMYNVRNS